MNPFAAIGIGTLALLALLFRPRRTEAAAVSRTAWSGEGLPRPVGTLEELHVLARQLVEAARASGRLDAGQVRNFQRRAGLVTLDPVSNISVASGAYDALTRRAVGYYGRFWQEETP